MFYFTSLGGKGKAQNGGACSEAGVIDRGSLFYREQGPYQLLSWW